MVFRDWLQIQNYIYNVYNIYIDVYIQQDNGRGEYFREIPIFEPGHLLSSLKP